MKAKLLIDNENNKAEITLFIIPETNIEESVLQAFDGPTSPRVRVTPYTGRKSLIGEDHCQYEIIITKSIDSIEEEPESEITNN